MRPAALSTLVLVLVMAPGCTRDAEIYDAPDATVSPTGSNEQVTIPPVEGLDLDSAQYGECEDRPEGDCRGTNDFLCDFNGLAASTVESCLRSGGCTADGWVSVSLDANGCLSEVGMVTVDDSFVECLVEALAPVRCPCSGASFRVFLGVENDGCSDDMGPLG